MDLLIDQLLEFPDRAFDDGPDALEGAIRLLEKNAGIHQSVEAEVIG